MKALALHALLISGTVAGGWMGYKEAEYIVTTGAWLISAFAVFAALMYPHIHDKMEKTRNGKITVAIHRTLFATTVVAMVAAGWIATGLAYLVSLMLFKATKTVIDGRAEQKPEAAPNVRAERPQTAAPQPE